MKVEHTSKNFFVAGIPVPQGAISHNKQGYGYHANDKELRIWREIIKQTIKPLFAVPIEGAVSLELHFALPRGKTVKRKFPIVRPDLDHYIRAVGDALTGIAYKDDSQVISLVTTKSYAITSYRNDMQIVGVWISVSSISDTDTNTNTVKDNSN